MFVAFEFLVLEHRPEHLTEVTPKSRTFHAQRLFKNGIEIKGQPRFEDFDITVSMPHNGQPERVNVRVIENNKSSFKVEFQNPTKNFKQSLNWWFEDQPAVDLSLDIGV